ncbi:MAG TPA: TonB family protein, partial [Candidatus Baltobacteraceae bacterium]|nr:TonB family protein [Candidatus Baltobacteraceae bacterium]
PPIAHGVAPSSGPRATAAATQAPTPAATAVALACAQHDITPAVTVTPQPVDIPADARASKASGVAAIQVQIDAQGHVTGATVAKSSGSTALDAVAVALAKGATYSPALVKCKPVAAAYTFTVKFVAW